jgi:Repeat of unknown function (DUF5648)
MHTTLRNTLCLSAFVAIAATFAPDALGDESKLPGENHYILCSESPCAASYGDGSMIPTFRISQIYSSLDGDTQFIELTEFAGLDGQHHFAGLTLSTSHNGVVKQFTFPSDLPSDHTANSTVVVATVPYIFQYMGGINGGFVINVVPDYETSPRFLATDGGTVTFAGNDHMDYDSMPTDGTQSWYRDGTIGVAALAGGHYPVSGPRPPGVLASYLLHPSPPAVGVVEYYAAARDHYFMSASAADIDALDSGRIGGWKRTGESFHAGGNRLTKLGIEYQYAGSPVCRFYLPPADGDSHFFSASQDECTAVHQQHSSFVFETDAAFFAMLPDAVTGACPTMFGYVDDDWPLTPVYRLWNRRPDTNHRYTTSLAIRDEMIGRGWVPEGYGPLGVAMCALR